MISQAVQQQHRRAAAAAVPVERKASDEDSLSLSDSEPIQDMSGDAGSNPGQRVTLLLCLLLSDFIMRVQMTLLLAW